MQLKGPEPSPFSGLWSRTRVFHPFMVQKVALLAQLSVVLCIAALWIGKRWLQVLPTAKSGGQIILVETLAMSRQCALHLVAVKNQRILIGVDGGGIKGMVSLVEPFEQSLSDLQAAGTRVGADLAASVDGAGKLAA